MEITLLRIVGGLPLKNKRITAEIEETRPHVNNKTGVIHVSERHNGYDVRVGRSFRRFVKDFDEACRVAKEARLALYGDTV